MARMRYSQSIRPANLLSLLKRLKLRQLRQYFPYIAAAICMALVTIAAAGWLTGQNALTSIIAGWPKMVPITASGLTLGAASLCLQASAAPRTRQTGAFLASAVFTVGVLLI